MNPLTLEWIDKAEGDYFSTKREIRARIHPNFDAACYHAQQSAEKYLKAILQEQGERIPRTHNLIDLQTACLEYDSALTILKPDIIALNSYSIRFRYPGESAEKQEAKAALAALEAVRRFIRNRFGLD